MVRAMATRCFSPRQLQAALADHRFVAVGQAQDEVVDMGQLRRPLDFLDRGAGTAIGDVVEDRVVEQDGVLRDDTDGGAQRRLRDGRDVLAVDQDAARVRIVEAEQQPADGRFSGAAGADDGDRAPGRDREGHPFRIGRRGS